MPDFSSIENLKRAEQQINEIDPQQGESEKEVDTTETFNWISSQDWQEILEEKQRLEKAYKEIEERQEKVRERLAIIKELEDRREKINKELREFGQKVALIKKKNEQ